MHKENYCHHSQPIYNPLGRIEQRLVKSIMKKFGTDVQVFYQRKPSRKNFQTESEKAFEKFMRRKFGEKIEINYESQEFVRITKPNGSIKITTSVLDYGIRLGKRKETFLEITSSSKKGRNGKNKRSKHNLIMKAGFGKDVDSTVELKMSKCISPNRIKTFGFRVLLPDEKMLLVKIPMRINKSVIKSKTEAVAKPGKTNSVILYGENLRKIEEKQHVRIIYDRSDGSKLNH